MDGKRYFLSLLVFQLTILAREAYLDNSKQVAKPKLLRCINEMQHKISGHLLKILKDDKHRYPDDILFMTLFQIADTDGFSEALQTALSLAHLGCVDLGSASPVR